MFSIILSHVSICLQQHVVGSFLFNVYKLFSERELTVCRRQSVRPSVACLSVTFVHPTQAIEIFGNVLRRLVRWPSADIQVKFYGDRPRGTPPSGELNTRGVAEYSDFGPIERYISETVQDRS